MPLQGLPQGISARALYPYISNRNVVVRGFPFGMTAIHHQQWLNPAAKVTNGYMTATAGPNATTLTWSPVTGPNNGSLVSAGVAQPDYEKNVVITVTHGSSVVALSGVITGYDFFGHNLISEAWSVTAGTTSKTFTGKKAFSQILSVTIVAATDASTDTVIIGTGDVLGLELNNALAGTGAAVKELVGGSIVTNGVFTAKGSDPNDPQGTYAPNTIPNGSTQYDVWYLSDDPENS